MKAQVHAMIGLRLVGKLEHLVRLAELGEISQRTAIARASYETLQIVKEIENEPDQTRG